MNKIDTQREKFNKALILSKLGKYPKSKEILIELLISENTNLYFKKQVYALYAYTLNREGDITKAIKIYNQCISEFPNFSTAHYFLSTLYYNELSGNEEYNYLQKALHHINIALKFSPLDDAYLIHKALVLMDFHEYEKAFIHLDKVKNSNHRQLLYGYYRFYFETKNTAESIKILNKALELYPNDEGFLYFKANNFLKAGKFNLAIKEALHILELNPTNSGSKNIILESKQKKPVSFLPALCTLAFLIILRLMFYYLLDY